MRQASDSVGEQHRPSGLFPETRWTRIQALKDSQETGPNVDRILGELCEAYWLPVYSYARRLGCSVHDAEDLTQGFFGMVLARGLFKKADRTQGKLRTFFKSAFDNYVAEHFRSANRIKRGGNRVILSFDEVIAEEHLAKDLAAFGTADAYFDHSWAAMIFRRALVALRLEYGQRGQSETFEGLCGQLTLNETTEEADASPAGPLAESGAARVAAFRLRQRFRRLIESEISETVDSPMALKEELRYLTEAYCATDSSGSASWVA